MELIFMFGVVCIWIVVGTCKDLSDGNKKLKAYRKGRIMPPNSFSNISKNGCENNEDDAFIVGAMMHDSWIDGM